MIVHLSSKMFSTIPQFPWIQKSLDTSKSQSLMEWLMLPVSSNIISASQTAPDFFSLGAFAPCEVHTVKSEQPRQQVSSHIMGNRLGTLQEMTRIASMFFLRPEILKRLNRTMSTQIFVVTMLTPLAYFWGLPPSRYR